MQSPTTIADSMIWAEVTSFGELAPPERELFDSTTPTTKAKRAITIALPPTEVIEFFSDTPGLMKVLIGTELTVERAGDVLTFRSGEESAFQASGELRFAEVPKGRGTVLAVTYDYSLPGGKLQEWMEMFSGHDPDTVLQMQLKRIKSFLETGEIPTTKGQASGRAVESEKTVH